MIGLKILSLTACAAVLTACASTGGTPRMGKMLSENTGQNGRACVRLGDIRGYGVLDDGVVSIDGGTRYYLATFLPGCNDLETSARAAFDGDFGEVCGRSMNRIVSDGDSCVINQMFEFESREAAFAAYDLALADRKALQGE
jgi:hypothetical protein